MTRLLLPLTALFALSAGCTDPANPPDDAGPTDDSDDDFDPDPDPSDDGVDPDPEVTLARIALSAPVIALDPGQSMLLSAEAYDTTGHVMPLPALTWRSSAPEVLAVAADGQVTARSAGTAQITASSGGVTGTLELGVRARIATVARVAIVPVDWELLELGATAQLEAVAYDAGDNVLLDRAIFWSSASPLTASVTPSGRIAGHDIGTVAISASCEGHTTSLAVTVAEAVDHVLFEGGANAIMYPQTSRQLTAVPYTHDNRILADRPVTYSGGHPAIAHVSATGLLTAVGNGTTTVIATIGSKTATLTVKVQTIASVQINRSEAIIDLEEPLQLRVVAYDTNNEPVLDGALWASSAPAIAGVDATGLVDGHAVGSATITATIGGHSVSARIIVTTWTERELATVNGQAVPATMVEYASTLGGEPSSFRMDLDGGFLATRAYDERYEMMVYGPVFVNGDEGGYHSFVSAGVMRFEAATQTYRFIPDVLSVGAPITGRPVAGGIEVTWQPDPQGAPATLVFASH